MDNRGLVIVMYAASMACHAAWGAMGALLLGTAAAAVCLFPLQFLAVEMFVLWSGSRVRDWLAGVLAPAVAGVAVFAAVRGRVTTADLAAFAVAAGIPHFFLYMGFRGTRRPPPPNS